MNQYFISNRDKYKDYANEISLLFMKRSIDGIYDEIVDAMIRLNGRLLSFALPYFEKATIKLNPKEADILINNSNLDIENIYIENLAKEFCKGAEINY